MNLKLTALIASAVALTACHETNSSRPEPRASTAVGQEPARAKTPAHADAPTPNPDNAGPLTAVGPNSEIPLGPVFPPARANVPLIAKPQGLKGLIYRTQRWFKDSVPAGEPHHFVHHDADPAAEPIKRYQDPETLRAALDVVSPYRSVISQILKQRSGNAITRMLDTYLAAEDSKTASSAAELVVTNIFAGDRSARAKLVELGGDFDAIKHFGYYDEATAGRFEYLQARADETYRRDASSHELSAAFFAVGLPAAIAYTLIASRSHVLGDGARAVVNAGEHAAALRAAAAHVYERGIMPAEKAIAANLDESILRGVSLKSDSVAAIKDVIAVNGHPTPKVKFTPTADPNLGFFEITSWDHELLPEGTRMFALRLQDGPFTKIATTGKLTGSQVDEFRAALKGVKTPTLETVGLDGVATKTDIPVNVANEFAANAGPRQPRAFRVEPEAAAPAPTPAGPAPKAYRLGDDQTARLTEDAVEAAPVAAAGAARGSYYGPTRPKYNHAGGVVGGFLAGATIGTPYYVGRTTGTQEGIEFNTLYFGGQIDTIVQPPSTTVTSDLMTQ